MCFRRISIHHFFQYQGTTKKVEQFKEIDGYAASMCVAYIGGERFFSKSGCETQVILPKLKTVCKGCSKFFSPTSCGVCFVVGAFYFEAE